MFPNTSPKHVREVRDFMEQLGFKVVYIPYEYHTSGAWGADETPEQYHFYATTDDDSDPSHVPALGLLPYGITNFKFVPSPWVAQLHKSMHRLTDMFSYDYRDELAPWQLLDILAGLLTRAGHDRALTAAYLGVWYGDPERLLFEPYTTDLARQMITEIATYASQTRLTMAQRIDCARRCMPVDFLNSMLDEGVPYLMLSEQYPRRH